MKERLEHLMHYVKSLESAQLITGTLEGIASGQDYARLNAAWGLSIASTGLAVRLTAYFVISQLRRLGHWFYDYAKNSFRTLRGWN